ncbi:MAG: hypothetical protein ACOYUZ_01280 [Patescibacteria group bacterium]
MGQPAEKLTSSLTPLQEMASRYTAWCWAAKLAHVITALQRDANDPRANVRKHDLATPFAVHPLWCAISILSAPDIEQDLRLAGYKVLLEHALEPQTGKAPDADRIQLEQIRSLRCLSRVKNDDGSLRWSAPPEIRLFKLFEVVHNLYDDEIDGDDLNIKLARDLVGDVQANFGNLKIIRIAKALLPG